MKEREEYIFAAPTWEIGVVWRTVQQEKQLDAPGLGPCVLLKFSFLLGKILVKKDET